MWQFGSSAGDTLTWQGGTLELAWGPPPSHGDWLGPKAAGWAQAGGRWKDLELLGVRGAWVGCWKMRLLLQAWMSPLEPVRHAGDGVNDHEVWHRITPSIQRGRSTPRSPSLLSAGKTLPPSGCFPKTQGFLELIPGTG